MVILSVLQGLIGLLTLEAAARPYEMPRTTLERLIGDIADQPIAAAMTMTGAAMDDGMESSSMTCCPAQEPAGDHKPRGDFRSCCALCGLLHLPPGLVPLLPALPLPVRGLFVPGRMISLVAQIVARRATLPPSRAPPLQA